MHRKKKGKRALAVHMICLFIAAAISWITGNMQKSAMGDKVPSYYYDDLSMPEKSISILDAVSIQTVHSRNEDLHIFAEQEDARLILEFADGEPRWIGCIGIVLEDGFPYELSCALYYPNPSGKYEEECKKTFVLPRGKRGIYFEIPDTVDYPFYQFRIDIDEDYTVQDVFISQEQLVGEFDFGEYLYRRAAAVHFFALFLLFEFFACLRKKIACGIQRAARKKIAAWMLVFIGAVAGGNAAASFLFQYLGRDYSWFWAGLFSLCGSVFVFEGYLLLRKSANGKKQEKTRMDTGKQLCFWISILLFGLLICFEGYDSFLDAPKLSDIVRFQFPFALAVTETFFLALLYRKYVCDSPENSIPFTRIYLFLIFLLGIGYMLLFLPYVSPDEPSHYLSAYRISNLFMGKIGDWGDGRLMIRMEDFRVYDRWQRGLSAEYYMRTTENIGLWAKEAGMVIVDGPMLTNAVFSYFASGLGIAAARIFHLSGYLAFYAGRLGNLLCFLLVLRHLMKKMPCVETALFTIAAMPMTLHMVSSYSYDVMTFCFVALFVIQVMHMIQSTGKIDRNDSVLCLVYGVLMAPSKMAFLPLVFLILLVPSARFGGNRKRAWGWKMLIIVSGMVSVLIILTVVSIFSSDSAVKEMVEAGEAVHLVSWNHQPGYTVSWVCGHIGEFALMCIRTMIRMTDTYFFNLIGSSLGWLEVSVPRFYTMISFLLFFLAINQEAAGGDAVQTNLWTKGLIIALCTGSVLITMLAMTLDWTPLTINYISGVQGRYFLPLLVPLVWVLKNRTVAVKSAIRKHVVLMTALLNMWILVYVFARNIVGA